MINETLQIRNPVHSKIVDSSVCLDKQRITVTQPSKPVGFFSCHLLRTAIRKENTVFFLLHPSSNADAALQKVSRRSGYKAKGSKG